MRLNYLDPRQEVFESGDDSFFAPRVTRAQDERRRLEDSF